MYQQQQQYPGYPQQYPQMMPAITCPRCRTTRPEGITCPACGLLAGHTGTSWQLAGVGRRFAGALLWGAIPVVAVIATIIVIAMMLSSGNDYYEDELTTGMVWAMVVTFMSPFIAYWVWWFMLAPEGQTPIKRLLGMRVVTASGAPAGVGPMLLRSIIGQHVIGYIVPLYGLVNALWLLWDRDRQCLHDKVASTYVVLAEPVAVQSGDQQSAGFYGQQPQAAPQGYGQQGHGYNQPQGYAQQPQQVYGGQQPSPQSWAAPAYATPQAQPALQTQAARFCRTCGGGLAADARFCAVCGTPAA